MSEHAPGFDPPPDRDESIPLFEENDARDASGAAYLPGDEESAPAVPVEPQGLLRGLNPEQLAAVTLPARPALILAGAGSGKTRVLTTRIAWLIQTGQLSPGGVMAVTFTN
ncbi:MAG TPA: UvrD-helicase domain-containing protein, partial [Caldimonas sp.]